VTQRATPSPSGVQPAFDLLLVSHRLDWASHHVTES
jgi:hypothetical protein